MRTFRLAAAVAALSLSAAGAASAQVTPQAISDWLSGQGMTPEMVTADDNPFLRVQDDGVTWLLFFYGCDARTCDSLQFGAGFTNEAVSLDQVNAWNRDRRFLKAYFEPGEEGSAIVQYDVIPTEGAPISHLGEHLALWRDTLNEFGIHVGFFTPAE